MKLYEYTDTYRFLIDQVESGECTDEDIRDTLELIRIEAKDAAANIAKVILDVDADSDKITHEIDRLRAKRDMLERRSRSIREYLARQMAELGMPKIQTPICTISLRKSSKVEVLPEFVRWAITYNRDELLRYKDPEPDKRRIAELLKAGEDLPARIVQTEGVTIR